ncbi:MAG: NEW3 domain-containing protein [Desulfatibacillaceae bacterium]
MRRGYGGWLVPVVLFILALIVTLPATAAGGPRAISVAFEHFDITLPLGEDVSVDLLVRNFGQRDEDVRLSLDRAPEGWDTSIKTFTFETRGVNVPGEDFSTLTFRATPPEGTAPGTYEFRVTAATADGGLKDSATLAVTCEPAGAEAGGQAVRVGTSYPILKGSSDSRFEFSLDVDNALDVEQTVAFTARTPPDWDVTFKPSYEEKTISSMRLKSRESRNLRVEVDPPRMAEAGEYPIKVLVSADGEQVETELSVVITGNYRLVLGTPSGVLSLKTEKGRTGNISVYVKNTGSAPNRGIELISVKPENWEVVFTPETVDLLEPGELRQVEVRVKPSEDAMVGDYSVSLTAQGENNTTDTMDLRVTVNAPTIWGWVGIAIILLVIAGLVALFVILGRR